MLFRSRFYRLSVTTLLMIPVFASLISESVFACNLSVTKGKATATGCTSNAPWCCGSATKTKGPRHAEFTGTCKTAPVPGPSGWHCAQASQASPGCTQKLGKQSGCTNGQYCCVEEMRPRPTAGYCTTVPFPGKFHCVK